ncbi:uncharacterized protein LOC123871192 [Maniola jurtina]|uniref:uncharacterized protein LOC123871192 n=1 Tax=Maniola jurtina TaxID=191418 RepID=UPI001E68896A|nr:uncharacterized protein LOC123871192 [Maniola jurtina]
MYTFKLTLISLSMPLVLCSISVRRTGWLDRVVDYHKNRFIDDFMKQPVKISARIERAPPGYVDSKDWDYNSVIHLLTLIRDSEGAAPVRQAFRRAMKTNRRFLSFSESFKAFPSLIKDDRNDFHYDVDMGEYYADVAQDKWSGILDPSDVIVVTNPVEAKLPSARISVELLKTILERRAAAVRVIPTTPLNISWSVTPKRTTTAKPTTIAIESTPSTITVKSTPSTITVESTPSTITVESTATDEVTTASPENDTSTASEDGNEAPEHTTPVNLTETS